MLRTHNKKAEMFARAIMDDIFIHYKTPKLKKNHILILPVSRIYIVY